MPYDMAAGLLMLTAMIVGMFYCLGALQGERRDRSILFWKSLPASDLTNRTIEEVVTTASGTFCQSALPAQFATLALGKADRRGNVELVKAGHNPVLLVDGADVEIIAAASLPLGMFCATDFTSVRRSISAESTLFLYSDGITESIDETGDEFDLNRLTETLLQSRNRLPSELVETIQRNIIGFTNGAQPSDDRTMLASRG